MESIKHDQYDSIKLENQFCFPLYACAKEVVRLYRKPLASLDLTYTQYIVMMVLWEFGGMTEGELGRIVRLESGTLAPLLKRLEKRGLIKRTRLESNERKLFLKLTPDGEVLKQKALAVPCAMQDCMQLPKEELLLLRELLNKALHSMERGASENGSEL
jgi:DNA-binding MarR family transcriptional regulator